MSELIGKTVGQYQIVEQIGRGGMATIFKAYQPSIDRYVAVKVLPKEFAEDPNFVKRFTHEAKAIAALEHPHILPVHDFGTEDQLTYMVMRYVKGGTLSDLMGEVLPYERITQIVGNVARALDYAHRQGVVHRDIKPSNVLIDEHGEVLLTDFGIAKIVEGSKATQLTAAGSVLGTPAYMAPEQARGDNIDGRTDIYSLGVVLYELLTGRPPYDAETPYAIIFKHVNDPLPPPRSVKPDIPEAFERVVLKAMAKDPKQRFETAGHMEQALQNALKETEGGATMASMPIQKTMQGAPLPSGTATPQSAPSPADSPQKRSSIGPFIIAGIAVVALLCLVAGGALILLALGSDDGTQDVAENVATSAIDANVGGGTGSETNETIPTSTPVPVAEDDNTSEDIIPESPVFEDEFESAQYDWFTGEDNDEYGNFSAEIEDGIYNVYITADSEDGNFAWLDPFIEDQFEDFELTIEVAQVESQGEFGYGVIFRASPEGDYYMFEVDDNGFVVYLAHADQDWEVLHDYTETSAINPGGPNLLGVIADDSLLTFIINDEDVAELTDTTLDRGSVGLVVDLLEEGELRVEFESFFVYEFEDN